MDDLELAKAAFHQSSIQSYVAARMMVATNYLGPIGFYNAHLACECMLKSLIAQAGVQPKPKHDLLFLLRELKASNNSPELDEQQLIDLFEWLNPYQELGRYGALARAQHDPERKDDPNLKAYGVIGYQASAAIKQIDYVFSLLYKLSDIDSSLITELQKGKTNPMWRYRIPLDEIVFFQNESLEKDEAN
jgi:hypothetical protein